VITGSRYRVKELRKESLARVGEGLRNARYHAWMATRRVVAPYGEVTPWRPPSPTLQGLIRQSWCASSATTLARGIILKTPDHTKEVNEFTVILSEHRSGIGEYETARREVAPKDLRRHSTA